MMSKKLFIAFLLSFCQIKTENSSFVLFTMLYNETDPVRVQEYKTCILKHKAHPFISDIFVVYDTSKDDGTNDLYSFLQEQEIPLFLIKGRAPYGLFFNLANTLYPEKPIIVANADIYFNHTLGALRNFDFTNKFLALTRWDFEADGSRHLAINYFTQQANPGSHDTWIFKTPLVIPGSEAIKMGIMGCDGSIAYLAKKAGYTLLNPCYTVETFHLHKSPVRHYWKEERYTGALLEVPCTYLSLSELSIS